MPTLTRYDSDQGERLQVRLSEELKDKVDELGNKVFINDYEGGSNRSQAIRYALRLLTELFEECDKDIDLTELRGPKRKYELNRWIEDLLDEGLSEE